MDDICTQLSYKKDKNLGIKGNDPLSCRTKMVRQAAFTRGSWKARLHTSTALTSDEKFFYLNAELKVLCDDEIFAERHFIVKTSEIFMICEIQALD